MVGFCMALMKLVFGLEIPPCPLLRAKRFPGRSIQWLENGSCLALCQAKRVIVVV
jgi:hypothetical protein